MDKGSLQGTCRNVSRVCLGTMTSGSQTDEPAAHRMIDCCLDAEINFLDTANAYNAGASEQILGRCIQGKRDRVVLATKVRNKMGEGANMNGLSRAAIMRAIDDSLRRLGTDYVDLYYLHLPDYDVPIEETLAAMEDLVKAGKAGCPARANPRGRQVGRVIAPSP